ncbi:MAG: YihY/virulence factor BrkB family protein [Pseudonocardia sp.]|nr:YihY/virulence factor BrkB family protein [Pseudonocardia sp.]
MRSRALRRGRWTGTVATVLRSAAAHRLPALAGESAFFAALAVVPVLLTVVAVLSAAGSVLGPRADAAAAQGLTSLLRQVLTARGSTAAEAAGELLAGGSGGLLTGGSAVALLLTVRALRSVLHGLGVVAGRSGRPHWYSALLLALVLLFGGSTVLAAVVLNPLWVTGVPVWHVLRWPVIAVALFAWALLVLRVGLGRPRARRGPVVGAAVATAGWIAASFLFPVYVAVAGRFTSTFGVLGGGLTLLVWLYLLTLSLHLGAETSVALSPGSGTRTTSGGRVTSRAPNTDVSQGPPRSGVRQISG